MQCSQQKQSHFGSETRCIPRDKKAVCGIVQRRDTLKSRYLTSAFLYALRGASYATYLKCEGKDYRKENLLSLSGVYQPKKEIQDSKVPIALTTFLKENPHIKTIILHLDNDKTGRLCTAALKELLKKDYEIVDDPPPVGKDFNDFLLSYLGMEQQKTSRERSDAR